MGRACTQCQQTTVAACWALSGGPPPRARLHSGAAAGTARVPTAGMPHAPWQRRGPARAQLYSGSADGSVRVWDLASGQCTSVVDVGGEVDSLLLEGGFLFVGLHVQTAGARQGLVKARRPPRRTLYSEDTRLSCRWTPILCLLGDVYGPPACTGATQPRPRPASLSRMDAALPARGCVAGQPAIVPARRRRWMPRPCRAPVHASAAQQPDASGAPGGC